MKILLVEDDVLSMLELEEKLRELGHEVVTATDASSAIEKGILERPDLVLSDWNLEDDINGIGVCNAIRSVYPSTRLIILTGSPRELVADEARDIPILTILPKPMNDDLMTKALEAAGGCA